LIQDIENGLPEIQDEEMKGEDDEFVEPTEWLCPSCKNLMSKTTLQCNICKTKKPEFKKKGAVKT
jgi:rubrerythrin